VHVARRGIGSCCDGYGPRGSLRNADAGKIGERAGRVSNKYKVAKHFELQIADGSFSYERKRQQIEAEAALDGLYVLRTTCADDTLTTQAVVRVYKQLKLAERAYRTIKGALDVLPIRHHLQDRVEAHFFLFLLTYYLLFELQARLRTDAVHRRHAARPSRPRRARPTFPRRDHQSRPQPRPRLQPPRPN
jgi:transposase